jgi:hypothetical protein
MLNTGTHAEPTQELLAQSLFFVQRCVPEQGAHSPPPQSLPDSPGSWVLLKQCPG